MSLPRLLDDPDRLVNEELADFLGLFTYGYSVDDFTKPVPSNDYGYEFPEGTQQLTIELYGYYIGGLGGTTRFQHLVNAIRIQLPSFDFVKNGVLNTSALRVLYACCEYKDLAIAGAASCGKTGPVGAFILIDWQAAPNKTLSIVCTTTISAAEDRIWGAIVKWHKACTVPIGTLVDYKKFIVWGGWDEKGAEGREPNNAIKAVAVEPGEEGKKAIGAFRGRKNTRVRCVMDELAEMDNYVINVRVNFASNIGGDFNDFRFYGIANPNRKDDPHGEMSQPKNGWDSVSPETAEWETRTGHCIFLHGEWSPNFLVNESESVPFPYLTNRQSIAHMLTLCYGNTDSLEYYRNAIGFWVLNEALRVLITRGLITTYGCDKPPTWYGRARQKLVGLDLGFTIGGDKCAAEFVEMGDEASGRSVISYLKESIYIPKANENFDESIAKQFVTDCINENIDPSNIGVDISSDGGKILQQIIKYWAFDPELTKLGKNNPNVVNIIAISSQGKPSNRPVSSVDHRPAIEAYDRRVTEYWANVREAVMCGVVKNIPVESEMVSQLCAREYERVKGANGDRIKIEKKEDTKARIKVSPDKADGFVYAVEVAVRKGLQFIAPDRFAEQSRRQSREYYDEDSGSTATGTYGSDSWGED